MLVPSMGVVFRYLSPPLFGMYWHTSARNVMALVQSSKKNVEVPGVCHAKEEVDK